MFSRLVDTVSRNGFEDRVILRNVALGGESSSQVLMILGGRPSSSGAHLASAVSDPNYRWETGPVVAVVTLDDDLDELGEAGVSAIKIDAEGFEHEVLSGGLHALREWRPGLIVEFHSLSALAEVQVPLRRFGYGRASFIDVDAQDDRGLDDDFLPGNYLLE
jgi:FkbM family methyltransferase